MLTLIKNVFDALSDDGVFITVEPGAGHSQTADSIQAMEKYGTTEKDMPFSLQREMMEEIGFGTVERYVRLSQLTIENVSSLEGSLAQVRHGFTLAYGSATGLTSIVVARKKAAGSHVPRIKPEELFQAVIRYDDIALQATWKTKVARKLLRLARLR